MQLLIFPCNGNGLEALACIGKDVEFLGFIDDTPEKKGTDVFGYKVFGREALTDFPDAKVLAVPGSPISYKVRDNIIQGLGIDTERYATVIHPKADISPLAKIGINVLIMAGVVVTSNAIIGNHVCILPNTVLHHDVVIDDYTLIGSNVTIAGSSRLGRNCYIGSGTSIINGITVGDKTLVGIGSNVIKTLPGDVKAIGNPSRIL
jgi:sugar O-acyltransferase (sialic acid O-acetyltransferase NeuD family)